MKTIAFAGSNSSASINNQLVRYAIKSLNNSEVIQLTDYEVPMYSEDLELSEGIPQSIKELDNKLSEADALVIAVGEHNGNISAFFKNILDWLSRYNRKFLSGKRAVVLSTSPGGNGASSALSIIENTLPYFGAEVIASLSIGNFHDVFKGGKIIEPELDNKIQETINNLGSEKINI